MDSLQIQRGVGTSSNGVASFAGSINFASARLAAPSTSNITAGYGSFASSRITGEYSSGMDGGFGLYVRASHLESDGYKYRSANEGSSVYYSAGWFGDRQMIKILGFVGHQKNELAWLGVPLDESCSSRTNGNSAEDDQFTQSLTTLRYTATLAQGLTLSSALYFNYLEGDYDFDLNNFLGMPSTEEMFNYAFSSRFLGGFANSSLRQQHTQHRRRYPCQYIRPHTHRLGANARRALPEHRVQRRSFGLRQGRSTDG